jgi:hypothetical protein
MANPIYFKNQENMQAPVNLYLIRFHKKQNPNG